MTSLEKIIEDLTDTSKTLAAPLLKTKVLASRIGNEELLKWTDAELTGYRSRRKEDIPEYRRGKPNFSCTYTRGYDTYTNQPLPILLLNDKFRDELLSYKFDESIQVLEALAGGEKGDMIGQDFGTDACAIITKQLKKPAAGNMRIVQMRESIQITEITQVLSVIRSKLLDFMLQLEKELPQLDNLLQQKLALPENDREKLDRIVHQTIIHAGDGNTITTGHNNSIQPAQGAHL